MRIQLTQAHVRNWSPEDADAIARHANNRKIWRNLRDGFPHPYTLEDARNFLQKATSMRPETYFCIASEQEAIGSIGFVIQSDVEQFSAEIGYWLSEQFWGRGIASEALYAVTQYAIENHGLHRLHAAPYHWNPASCRVLEKAGYMFEGRMRNSIFKDGQWVDQMLFAYVVSDVRRETCSSLSSKP